MISNKARYAFRALLAIADAPAGAAYQEDQTLPRPVLVRAGDEGVAARDAVDEAELRQEALEGKL